MNKLGLLLTLLVVSICSVQSAWADRVAPDLPTAVAPESGQTYYLYNVMEDKFLCRSTTSTSNAAIGTYGDKITVTATATEGEYTIQWANNNYYLRAYDSYVSSGSSSSNSNYFNISESAKGYSIQRSPKNTSYYKSDEYLGYNGTNGDRITPALAEGSIHWQFMTVDEAEHYFAKHKLYTVLNVADQYNFYINQYEDVYNDNNSTTEQLNQAQETLNDALSISNNFVSPEWTDYPILFQNTTENKWKLRNYNNDLGWYLSNPNGEQYTSTLIGTVNVDEDVTLVYNYSGSAYSTLRVYLDGELVQNIPTNVANNKERNYYIEMPAGNHDISWTCIFNGPQSSSDFYHHFYYIGVEKTPTIVPATTTVEGQLGTEILKIYDNVSEVRKIIITGVIGADDWTTIGIMNNAFTIDMSGATAVADIPADLLSQSKLPFLHSIKLPQGLRAIGDRAFYESDIEDEITFPNTLESIGYQTFKRSKIKAAYMPNSVNSVDGQSFAECSFLENASWSSAAATIPSYCFSGCMNLRTFEIPEGVTRISYNAFEYTSVFNPRFPSSLLYIENEAFRYSGIDELIISEHATVYAEAFKNCPNLIYAEWPTSFSHIKGYNSWDDTDMVLINCPQIKDVYFKSPTKVTYDRPHFFDGNTLSNITLHVPSYLVNTYKLDPYWYQCNVVGFDTEDVKDWHLKSNLTLQEGERISGEPNIIMYNTASLTINGDDAMTIDNFSTEITGSTNTNRAMVISNCNNISITGDYTYKYYTQQNEWYFITLPFDVKVSNITSPGCSHAVRYYDGATRATNGMGSNWKNYTKDDVIPAGTGFIYQTSKDCWSEFVAENNATKNYVFTKNEFVKALEAHPSEVTANKGWNLVGNPWLSYYNIHKLNFTAPITVWNGDNYSAYSIIDDDFAILPSQAFFVQCPDEINNISFPIDGRQLTDEIESQNASRIYKTSATPERQLIDIQLSDGEQTDKTRIVLNPKAKMDYETSCDASKFFSLDNSVPQIYTLQNGIQMAINERPAGDGIVKLGIMIPVSGTYTIKSERNMLNDAVLVDLQEGTETRLSTDSYTFSANSGITDTRFEVRLSGNNATGIQSIEESAETNSSVSGEYYNLNGQRIETPSKGVYVVNGKKVIIK